MKTQGVVSPDTAHSPSDLETHRKVVIRYLDGRVLRAYLTAEEDRALQGSAPESFSVQSMDGNRAEVLASDIKAIFFVKSFEGTADYSEFKVFSAQPNGKGVWVQVQFQDGEMMEGVAPNRIDTYVKPVFSMTPPDPASNNQTVLVAKRSLVKMQVLGVAAD